jgi:DNA-binding transcriptional regulator YdaS (Cro superfamily)
MQVNWPLKKRITELFRSQADFCGVIGESESVVSRIIRGRRELPPEKRDVWARVLRCKSEDLFSVQGVKDENHG